LSKTRGWRCGGSGAPRAGLVARSARLESRATRSWSAGRVRNISASRRVKGSAGRGRRRRARPPSPGPLRDQRLAGDFSVLAGRRLIEPPTRGSRRSNTGSARMAAVLRGWGVPRSDSAAPPGSRRMCMDDLVPGHERRGVCRFRAGLSAGSGKAAKGMYWRRRPPPPAPLALVSGDTGPDHLLRAATGLPFFFGSRFRFASLLSWPASTSSPGGQPPDLSAGGKPVTLHPSGVTIQSVLPSRRARIRAGSCSRPEPAFAARIGFAASGYIKAAVARAGLAYLCLDAGARRTAGDLVGHRPGCSPSGSPSAVHPPLGPRGSSARADRVPGQQQGITLRASSTPPSARSPQSAGTPALAGLESARVPALPRMPLVQSHEDVDPALVVRIYRGPIRRLQLAGRH